MSEFLFLTILFQLPILYYQPNLPPPPHMATGAENVLATQATVGLFFSALLAYLKKAKWISVVNEHSATINHAWMLLTSAFGALGVHTAWNAAGHSLTITGLDLATIGASLWLWAKQYAVQILVNKNVFGAIATAKTP